MELAEYRAQFGRQMARSAGLPEESRIAEIFACTRREDFVGPPPWRIFSGDGEGELIDTPELLYQDVLVQLKSEAAINNGQPSLHALCIAAMRLEAGETIVHVGAGTGYYTAMLGMLAGSGGRVEAYEIEADLATRARENLNGMPWIAVHPESGAVGPLPVCDVLYVNAGATHPLNVWLEALKVGGRLLFPLTPDEGYGGMLMVTRTERTEGYAARFLCGAKFVGCAGARDTAMARRLAACFARGHAGEVRSLRRGSGPDRSLWCEGAGWWLSTRISPEDKYA
jgi:protein-L-isoaspartate(D-aspartate) O-methyltransferase